MITITTTTTTTTATTKCNKVVPKKIRKENKKYNNLFVSKQ